MDWVTIAIIMFAIGMFLYKTLLGSKNDIYSKDNELQKNKKCVVSIQWCGG